MCTPIEIGLLASTVFSGGSALHAANTRAKPKQQQGEKQPVVRQRRNPSARTGGGGADTSFGLLNVGSPTLLGS